MLISDEEATSRLSSPMNLMNRLRKASPSSRRAESAMGLFVGQNKPEVKTPEVLPAAIGPSPSYSGSDNGAAPTLDSILDNADNKIKQELIHKSANDALSAALSKLVEQLPAEEKPQKLADIAVKMSKIVTDIRNDRKGNTEKEKQVHLHFYTPERKKLSDFKEIEV